MRYMLLAFALTASVASAAIADPDPSADSNITVTTCHAQLDPPPLRIVYKNTAPSTVTEVDFDVRTPAGLLTSVNDEGKFASGATINHVFSLPSGSSPLGMSQAHCDVTKVKFADGTVWPSPSPSP
ncbi:MAG TPA: hypothetical protein VGF18_00670 [Candidatus Tumulicola sp.]